MLSEPARILAISGDQVQLETSRSSTCGRCAIKNGCGHHLLSARRENLWLSRAALLTENSRDLAPGALVTLGVQGKSVAGLALLFYLLPLLSLVLAIVLARLMTSNEAWLALSACAGLALGFAALRSVLPEVSPQLRCTLMSSEASPSEFRSPLHES